MIQQKSKLVLLFLLLLINGAASGQNVKGFYLTGIGSWLGDAVQENAILSYAQGNGYNYIAFYDLGAVNWTSTTDKNNLAAFMKRARTQYGLLQMGAIVETYSYFTTNILPFNNSRNNSNEKFDVIDLEFEFWVHSSISSAYCSQYLSPNGYSCDTAGAFKFAWKQFKLIDSACAALGLISEIYLGWPNKGQMQQLASRADRILLHSYRPNDNDVYSYSRNRLIDIASLGVSKRVVALFSAEPAFMGAWLATHPLTRAYQTYSADFTAETSSFKQNIDLQGYQWFTYYHMPKTMLAMATISVSGPLTFCTGGSVTLTANSGSQYLWLPGGQTTRSVTISSAGTYTVRVTNSSGLNATSSPVVVAITSTGTPPSISASGHASFCAGGNVVLTSSLASNYLWSNGATTQAITVSTAGSYTVRTTSGSCVGTSSPLIVTVTSAPPIPVITANGPLDICDGTDITLTSSSLNVYLWSNGETTQSIIVSSTGNYSVRVYSGPSCSSESVESAVVVHSIPATPVISAGGPLHLSMTNTSVTLTSTTAYSYLWSNGASVRDITVTLPGTYYVTIESASGCTSTSSSIAVTSDNCTPPPVPLITLSGSNVIMAGDSVTLTASSGSGYLWSTGETTQSIIVSNDGTFSVSVYSGPACYSTSNVVTISTLVPTGIIDEFSNESSVNQIKIYPNPVDDEFLLSFKIEQMKSFDLKIYDVCGREIFHQKIIGIRGENNVFVNVSEVKPGIYFAYLNDGEHKEMVKVIVE